MRHLAAFLLLALAATIPLHAEVVRPAPAFTWLDAAGKPSNLAALRGRPVVLLLADSPRSWAFRSQVGQLQKLYGRLAGEKLVCAAAFSAEPGPIRSDIPFLPVPDGAATAAAYDIPSGFGIAIIGMDGNLDFIGSRVVPAQRILDIIDNSAAKQEQLRRD